MKYLIIILSLFASTAYASGLYSGSSLYPDYGTPYGGHDRYQSTQVDTYRGTQTRRNVFGGRDIHRPGYSPITTRPNIFGGEDFYGGDRY